MGAPKVDEIGRWSEVKLDIIKRYAVAYSQILSNQKGLSHAYIDAFAGTGYHLSRTSGEMVAGSPLNALLVKPPFHEFHLIDLDGDKIEGLQNLVGNRRDVHFYHVIAIEFYWKKFFRKSNSQTSSGVCVCLILIS